MHSRERKAKKTHEQGELLLSALREAIERGHIATVAVLFGCSLQSAKEVYLLELNYSGPSEVECSTAQLNANLRVASREVVCNMPACIRTSRMTKLHVAVLQPRGDPVLAGWTPRETIAQLLQHKLDSTKVTGACWSFGCGGQCGYSDDDTGWNLLEPSKLGKQTWLLASASVPSLTVCDNEKSSLM
eukprot:TRINITY_DN6109_c0_g1_i1.p1 TRINITY_DN6109_c0_g1~~TRINITY_DN6109_c0_g1_i1.p1  ORF type:complete len:187 (+),score=27.34 TRINITY_DN6109_c0_g1_i1:295-855(+)